MQKTLNGIIPPMVTPLKEDGKLDEAGLERLVAHILNGGVHGLFLLGTTGEAPDLDYSVRHELVRKTCRLVNGRVPVLVGVTDTVFAESLRLAATAKDEGAIGVVAAPPYYFAPGQPELVEYYQHLANHLPLPLYLYNMPSHTKVSIHVETLVELAQNPHIAGLKDSSANIVYFNSARHALRERKDFSILIGPEEALAETVLMGGNGGVCGGANLFPRLFVEVYNAAVAGNVRRVHELQDIVMDVSASLYGVGHYMSSFLKGVKCSLDIMGICRDTMTEPFEHFRKEERDIIHARLTKLQDRISASVQ